MVDSQIKKTILTLGFLLVLLLVVHESYTQNFSSSYQFVKSKSYVQDKNFYLFTLIENLPSVTTVFNADTALAGIANTRLKQLSIAAATCKENVPCHVNSFQWLDTDVTKVSNILARLYRQQLAIRQMVSNHMRPSGYYQKYQDVNDEVLLVKAWQDAANGMNLIMKTYALGTKPKYPAIDSASYDVSSLMYKQNINIIVTVLNALVHQLPLFYLPSLSFSLQLLDINMRDEAARLEPLTNINKQAIAYLQTVKWDSFKYNAILVPGAGPDIEKAAIDPWAKSRLQIAVDRFNKKLAPVIIVSGGFVKPFQTAFCEALEMKKYLMQAFKIPEERIIVEPHARHTTTNLRNTVRLMYRYNMPVFKTTLIISDMYQTKTIQSEKFKQRCLNELGYLPFGAIQPLGIFETEFLCSKAALYMDSLDPLDP